MIFGDILRLAAAVAFVSRTPSRPYARGEASRRAVGMVPAGDTGVLQNDLDCSRRAAFWHIVLEKHAVLELAGHAIVASAGSDAIRCLGNRCTVHGPGDVSAAAASPSARRSERRGGARDDPRRRLRHRRRPEGQTPADRRPHRASGHPRVAGQHDRRHRRERRRLRLRRHPRPRHAARYRDHGDGQRRRPASTPRSPTRSTAWSRPATARSRTAAARVCTRYTRVVSRTPS